MKLNKLKTALILLIIILSVNIVSAGKGTGSGGGGLPNDPLIDAFRNSLLGLSISISCDAGYVYCFEQNNIYGDAQALARVFVTDPFVEGTSVYMNYKGEGTKYYVYRGITSWDQVHCDQNGCDGTVTGSNGKYLLGSAPSTSQKGVAFVIWDYNSNNGYWTWTWVGQAWFGDFKYNLQLAVTPQPTTPALTATPIVKGAPVTFEISPLPVNMTVSTIGTIPVVSSPHVFTLLTGTYTYTIEKPGYVSSSGSFTSAVGVPDTKTIVLQPIEKSKPVIIPPAISGLWETILGWIGGFFPLTIAGGVSIHSVVNQPYSTSISLEFTAPDTNYLDGTYESKYGEWLIIDGAKNIKYESGWSSELKSSPYTATASFIPTTPGTYYLIGVLVKQNYVYANNVWSVTETVETKEIQKIIIDSGPGPTLKPPSTNIIAVIIAWLMSLFI